ncbi:MAG: hydroxysqualene dehydroxylase HpnE [Planctomycetota bacterium]
MDLENSYRVAERISRSSGSSFFRSFQFLKLERRRAMYTLYAFARLADDATDDAPSQPGWNRSLWMDYLDSLLGPEPHSQSIFDSQLPSDLAAIRPALVDVARRYRIPVEMLQALVQGMETDARGDEIPSWSALRQYAFQVASSIGICCTAIWTDGNPIAPEDPLWTSAVDCGIAFQLTNILRDLREDAARGRVYLPTEDLERFGISRSQWLGFFNSRQNLSNAQLDGLSELIAVQIERARGLFARGWQLHRMLDSDSFRMFSLMWHTYRRILAAIERDPNRILQERVRINRAGKLQLAASHCFTPLLLRTASRSESKNAWMKQIAAPKFSDRNPRVAVVGGGLAGMNAALLLARHGCEVVLCESKSRLGGRAGSFLDPATSQAVDYCQHVGMQCCSELQRWIARTGSTSAWRIFDTLHFVSKTGRRLDVRAWPLPAPLHLSGLILGWPDLSPLDRVRVATGLAALLLAKDTPDFEQMPARTWLVRHFQNDRTIDRFWGTILVSALGEQVDRVAMGPVKKVLVDGFAATRDAFHLLVPSQPLSKLMDEVPRSVLEALRVEVRSGSTVPFLNRSDSGDWRLGDESGQPFDAVVVTVPWHRLGALLRDSGLSEYARGEVAKVAELETSPITGVHTWWDRPWLTQPHAILIDRFCQWVFPGPDSVAMSEGTGETYYQVVISGSRQLPRGDQAAILAAVERDLQELFPAAAASRMLRGKVVTDPQSVFSVTPGHTASRLSPTALASEGVFLGGDWVDTGWPATMEGALRSGSLAAQGALAYLGRPAQLLDE